MSELRYTLLADGPSDQALIPVLDWLLREHLPGRPIHSQGADLRSLRRPPTDLAERIQVSVQLHPCDILFVHRDAEAQSRDSRMDEIVAACEKAGVQESPLHCCVVPVRMTEAWFLFDEAAIREAAGNPRGRMHLSIPGAPESLSHPEQVLAELLINASGLSGRRRGSFNVSASVQRLARLIGDFSPLRGLPAFQALEADLQAVLQRASDVAAAGP